MTGKRVAGLSPREMVVFDLLGRGYSYVQIADQLTVAKSTIDSQVESICSKLALSRQQLRPAATDAYVRAEVSRRILAHLPGGGPNL